MMHATPKRLSCKSCFLRFYAATILLLLVAKAYSLEQKNCSRYRQSHTDFTTASPSTYTSLKSPVHEIVSPCIFSKRCCKWLGADVYGIVGKPKRFARLINEFFVIAGSQAISKFSPLLNNLMIHDTPFKSWRPFISFKLLLKKSRFRNECDQAIYLLID